VPGYVLLNAVLGYEQPGGGIDINVKNITDQRYFVAANAAGALVGQPLNAFVTAHFDTEQNSGTSLCRRRPDRTSVSMAKAPFRR
jgi:outer membrane receptor protein involved in Fe transport